MRNQVLGQVGCGAVASVRMNLFSSQLTAKRCFRTAAFLLGLWAFAWPVFGELRINEFLAVNNRGLADGDGEALDWIEIYNPGAKTVPLGGWALSDDAAAPDKWLLPDIALGPRSISSCSPRGRIAPTRRNHTRISS